MKGAAKMIHKRIKRFDELVFRGYLIIFNFILNDNKIENYDPHEQLWYEQFSTC